MKPIIIDLIAAAKGAWSLLVPGCYDSQAEHLLRAIAAAESWLKPVKPKYPLIPGHGFTACEECGSKLNERFSLCPHCGRPVDWT
jgi:hypothetical protein